MENTGKVYFEDDKPQWYIASGDAWVGPLAASDVYQKVVDQEISLAHFVWKPGQANWKRICDIETFQTAVPALPPKGMQAAVKASSSASASSSGAAKKGPPPPPGAKSPKLWYLHYNDGQFGPFSGEDIRRFISVGKIHAKVHVWRDGMDSWDKLGEVEEFAAAFAEAKGAGAAKKPPAAPLKVAKPAKPSDKRTAPRSPMVARILLANTDSISVAICRDVSVGGMQVLTDRVPGAVGTRIKMNVTPTAEGKQAQFAPFVAEGTIVRVLEDGRGFSFRFDRLSEQARRSIEDYIRDSA
jgi:hypothetical protein